MNAFDGMFFMLIALCLSGMQAHLKMTRMKKRLDALESRLGLKTADE